MKQRSSLEAATVLVVALAVAGCGGGGGEVVHEAGSAETGVDAAPTKSEPNACELVTREDATALFGQPASPDSGTPAYGMIGRCLWTWDSETSNQLLQFHMWDQVAYDRPDDSETLDLGEKGYVRAHPVAGVDISWIQEGRTISLSYSTIGPEAPEAVSKVEEMKALARRVARRLVE